MIDNLAYYLLANDCDRDVCSSSQYLVLPPYVNQRLSDKGWDLYQAALKKLDAGDVKGSFKECSIVQRDSGSLPFDLSLWENGKEPLICNCRTNVKVVGDLEDGSPRTTSYVIFFDAKRRFVYTMSDSIYKLPSLDTIKMSDDVRLHLHA